MPPASTLPGDVKLIRVYVIAEDAYGIKTWLMKPFVSRGIANDERIFNQRKGKNSSVYR